MEIRKCTADDVIKVGAFYDSVVKYLCENTNYPKWTYKEYPSENSAREMTKEGSQFVCVDNDEVMGAFVLNDDPQGKYENALWSIKLEQGEYMVCHAFATAVSIHRQGIGRQMIEYCIRYAKNNGYRAIRLDVVPSNTPARKLYEKYGFKYVGDVDLERNIDYIPFFSMYELNF